MSQENEDKNMEVTTPPIEEVEQIQDTENEEAPPPTTAVDQNKVFEDMIREAITPLVEKMSALTVPAENSVQELSKSELAISQAVEAEMAHLSEDDKEIVTMIAGDDVLLSFKAINALRLKNKLGSGAVPSVGERPSAANAGAASPKDMKEAKAALAKALAGGTKI